MNDIKLQKDILALINWLCVEWGFCITNSAAEKIANRECIDAETFAIAVLKAEGMNPDYEVEWLRKIKHRFRQTFGANSVDINNY